MSDDVEIVRRAFESWNDGGFGEWMKLHHSDVVIVPPEGWPESETSLSLEAWVAQAMRLSDSWEEQRLEVDEVRQVGDRVLAFFRWVTRGKGSKVELDTEMANVSVVRDGKIARQEYFLDRDAALAAAEGAPPRD